MKKAMKSLKLNLIGAALSIVGVGVPFGIYGITVIPSLNVNPFPYMYLLYIFALAYLLLGFVISDIRIVRWRRNNAEYDTKLPQEVKDKAWTIRYPFYMGAVTVFTVTLVFEICFWIMGSYPLPMNF